MSSGSLGGRLRLSILNAPNPPEFLSSLKPFQSQVARTVLLIFPFLPLWFLSLPVTVGDFSDFCNSQEPWGRHGIFQNFGLIPSQLTPPPPHAQAFGSSLLSWLLWSLSVLHTGLTPTHLLVPTSVAFTMSLHPHAHLLIFWGIKWKHTGIVPFPPHQSTRFYQESFFYVPKWKSTTHHRNNQ